MRYKQVCVLFFFFLNLLDFGIFFNENILIVLLMEKKSMQNI